jgi:hypothetical protein
VIACEGSDCGKAPPQLQDMQLTNVIDKASIINGLRDTRKTPCFALKIPPVSLCTSSIFVPGINDVKMKLCPFCAYNVPIPNKIEPILTHPSSNKHFFIH